MNGFLYLLCIVLSTCAYILSCYPLQNPSRTRQIYPNPSPRDLYGHMDFSTADPVMEASIIRQSYADVQGSFDWCKVHHPTRCRSCTVLHRRPGTGALCDPCTHCSAELTWPDDIYRPNPTLFARLPGIAKEAVVKFLCILGTNRTDPEGVCARHGGRQPPVQWYVRRRRVFFLLRQYCSLFEAFQ
jgi:hypothetical protein